ncbi:MAG: hypothetical protein GQ574_25795 [Crocinitomix sp.]|nr:hypothetical protein [Crocinitomix sp.]
MKPNIQTPKKQTITCHVNTKNGPVYFELTKDQVQKVRRLKKAYAAQKTKKAT